MVTIPSTIQSEPVLPNPAIKKPTIAWPNTEALSQMPWLQVVAFCNKSFGMISPTKVPKLGPVKERIIPVQKITK